MFCMALEPGGCALNYSYLHCMIDFTQLHIVKSCNVSVFLFTGSLLIINSFRCVHGRVQTGKQLVDSPNGSNTSWIIS